jgi:hypothetical protein
MVYTCSMSKNSHPNPSVGRAEVAEHTNPVLPSVWEARVELEDHWLQGPLRQSQAEAQADLRGLLSQV